jgi:hypothetical protein
MKPTRTRLLGLAAALTTIAIAAPVSAAGAATAAALNCPPAVTRPSHAPAATVVGPTCITTTPGSFTNTNIQVSTSGLSSGSQVAE